MLEIGDDGGLQILFGIRASQAEEVEQVRVFEGVAVVGDFRRGFLFLDGDELARVAREGDALEQRAGDLAGELARGPPLRSRLLEVEPATLRIALPEEQAVVRPAEMKVAGEVDGEPIERIISASLGCSGGI